VKAPSKATEILRTVHSLLNILGGLQALNSNGLFTPGLGLPTLPIPRHTQHTAQAAPRASLMAHEAEKAT